ncbi:MAG: OsmC family protein [Candidatus Thermoplasmatota archaeon]|jgi:putative redox protein|nr:OsmC family protein [Candidatus Thermoplasmatota archaeon]MCL5789346.1 OsmC family protein [Candidatus Thermoplasmatota archaeon]
MRAKVEWVDGLTFLSSDDSGHYVILDHSEDKSAQKGSSPTNMLLEAMCGCTAMDVISILKKKKEPVTGLEVIADGTRATEHPKVFTDINIEYVAYGNVKKESLERAIALSQEKYCNISITLKRAGVKVNVSSRIVEGTSDSK